MGMVLLLGICLFFLLVEKHPFWAGVALLMPISKPHIFAVLWLVLAIWTLMRKQWALLAGSSIALLLTTCIALGFDPRIFQHYREMMQQQAIHNEFIPALSGMIRALFFRNHFWVQFVPMVLGLLWALWYFWKNQDQWNWRVHGPAVLVVSVLTTPYAWMTDEVVLLPAILQGVLWLSQAKLRIRSQFVVLLFVCLNLLLLMILRAQVPPSTGIYFWSGLVWFGWYWYARSFAEPTNKLVNAVAV